MRMFRRSMGISLRVKLRNEEIRRSGVTKISDKIKKARLRRCMDMWWGEKKQKI